MSLWTLNARVSVLWNDEWYDGVIDAVRTALDDHAIETEEFHVNYDDGASADTAFEMCCVFSWMGWVS